MSRQPVLMCGSLGALGSDTPLHNACYEGDAEVAALLEMLLPLFHEMVTFVLFTLVL